MGLIPFDFFLKAATNKMKRLRLPVVATSRAFFFLRQIAYCLPRLLYVCLALRMQVRMIL